jgi:hypothetical protein
MLYSAVPSHTCDAPGVTNECAPVTVKVPAGRTYFVSVWSDLNVHGGSDNQIVFYRSAIVWPGGDLCGVNNPGLDFGKSFTNWAGGINPASSSGEFGPLSAGTHTFYTAIFPGVAESPPAKRATSSLR